MQKLTTKTPVLVLNASYEPIAFCSASRALVMWSKGVARVEETYDRVFYRDMSLPAVVRLSEYRRVPQRKHTATRKNILLRDRNTCQYCQARLSPAVLTLDHVHPRSRGGTSTWENLVACCGPCNRRKANRTPSEAGMTLLAKPREMNLHASRALMRAVGGDVPAWRKYLYF